MYPTWNWENSYEKSEQLLKELLTGSDTLLDHWISFGKECWFLWGNQFYTQRRDGANTSIIWSSHQNCYCHNDALQKHKSNGSLTWWRYRLLWYCYWSLAKRYISIIFVYTMPKLCTLIIISHGKRQEADNIPQKLWQMQTMQMT